MSISSDAPGARLACVEIGGSSCQTVVFGPGTAIELHDSATCPPDATLLVASPGLILGDRVAIASNLGWLDVDPSVELRLGKPLSLLANDAEAAALGEAVLRGPRAADGIVFVSLGTGVGGAVVRDGRVVAANLLGHLPGFSDDDCPCGRRGCLETVAAGWALPDPLDETDETAVAAAVARAFDLEPLASSGTIVISGGLARAYPAIVEQVAARLPHRSVEPSMAPPDAKSAAAWGLRNLYLTGLSVDGRSLTQSA